MRKRKTQILKKQELKISSTIKIEDMMLDPDFSLYSDEVEEAHTIKQVIGFVPRAQDNW